MLHLTDGDPESARKVLSTLPVRGARTTILLHTSLALGRTAFARATDPLGRLADALSTEDIANALYLSVNTVKAHRKSIYRKLGTSGRSAVAQRARELNLSPTSVPDNR